MRLGASEKTHRPVLLRLDCRGVPADPCTYTTSADACAHASSANAGADAETDADADADVDGAAEVSAVTVGHFAVVICEPVNRWTGVSNESDFVAGSDGRLASGACCGDDEPGRCDNRPC